MKFFSSIVSSIVLYSNGERMTREMFYSGVKKPNLGTIFERPLPKHQLLLLEQQPRMFLPISSQPPKPLEINNVVQKNITHKITPASPADPSRAIRSGPTQRNSFAVELEAFVFVAMFYYLFYLIVFTLYHLFQSK